MTSFEFEIFLNSIGGLIDSRTAGKKIITADICECSDGWLDLIAELITELITAGWNREICQVKEKFGGLRFYTNDLPENLSEIIIKFERLSYQTCELCGHTEGVQLRGSNWLKSLCGNHMQNLK